MKRLPLLRRIAHRPGTHRFIGESAALEVCERISFCREAFDKEIFRRIERRIEALALVAGAGAFVFEFDARFFGKKLQRTLEIKAFHLFDESEHVAAFSRREAVIETLVWGHEKRRRLFLREG